ncbi:hypothetical protein [Pseudomonas glycinae]|uniref:RRM domain-containing protein n=1 Tax=Pseudomonas glycinae TaxID=1785145 RepID=A0ABM6QHK5_9PSED|nr:hypothetical protein [Pseudomonas glycinae]AUG97429.1 hypothetical protein AWU82_28555 [Pseudomonas glycinae]
MTTVTVSDVPVDVTDAVVVEKLRTKYGVLSVTKFDRSSDGTRAQIVFELPQPKQTQEKLMVEVSSKKIFYGRISRAEPNQSKGDKFI